jgi:hypothetical protein
MQTFTLLSRRQPLNARRRASQLSGVCRQRDGGALTHHVARSRQPQLKLPRSEAGAVCQRLRTSAWSLPAFAFSISESRAGPFALPSAKLKRRFGKLDAGGGLAAVDVGSAINACAGTAS